MGGKEQLERIMDEVKKVIVGKEDIIKIVLMAILAKGHILVEDIPGVGKTTMALAFSKTLGLNEKRVQFTPDVLPADLTGFTVYEKNLKQFVYQPGAVMCNLLLADEINRTSPKTQSALLEVMQERQVTVDGVTRRTGEPFIVIATENPSGSAGTQLLPESQLDRFMVCVKMGYPSAEEEVAILKRSQGETTTDRVAAVVTAEEILVMQEEAEQIYVHDRIYEYIVELVRKTRKHEMTEIGISPRGTVALLAMAKANAYVKGREYVIPEDVTEIFLPAAVHRIQLSTKAKVGHIQPEDVILRVMKEVAPPSIRKR